MNKERLTADLKTVSLFIEFNASWFQIVCNNVHLHYNFSNRIVVLALCICY